MDWQGLGIVTVISLVVAVLGYFMSLRWAAMTGYEIEPGVTKPFLVKMWSGIGLIGPVMTLLYQVHFFN